MSLSELYLDGTSIHGMKSSLGFILELINGARLSNEVSAFHTPYTCLRCHIDYRLGTLTFPGEGELVMRDTSGED